MSSTDRLDEPRTKRIGDIPASLRPSTAGQEVGSSISRVHCVDGKDDSILAGLIPVWTGDVITSLEAYCTSSRVRPPSNVFVSEGGLTSFDVSWDKDGLTRLAYNGYEYSRSGARSSSQFGPWVQDQESAFAGCVLKEIAATNPPSGPAYYDFKFACPPFSPAIVSLPPVLTATVSALVSRTSTTVSATRTAAPTGSASVTPTPLAADPKASAGNVPNDSVASSSSIMYAALGAVAALLLVLVGFTMYRRGRHTAKAELRTRGITPPPPAPPAPQLTAPPATAQLRPVSAVSTAAPDPSSPGPADPTLPRTRSSGVYESKVYYVHAAAPVTMPVQPAGTALAIEARKPHRALVGVTPGDRGEDLFLP
ncbi:hypothetical protein H9P43_009135 [Blastocladiella emersonii ATCC 22665]|nr:hypothetical protein H9P43_009133 [Blastocladiella emersonii ATCC 22665]KAI9156025.1 hypothetical protein H9P43_009135 [Blastocladiella emersonii ATCC 22665]